MIEELERNYEYISRTIEILEDKDEECECGGAYEEYYCPRCPYCQTLDRLKELKLEISRRIYSLTKHKWEYINTLHSERYKNILIFRCGRCLKYKHIYKDGKPVEPEVMVWRWLITETPIWELLPKQPWSREE